MLKAKNNITGATEDLRKIRAFNPLEDCLSEKGVRNLGTGTRRDKARYDAFTGARFVYVGEEIKASRVCPSR